MDGVNNSQPPRISLLQQLNEIYAKYPPVQNIIYNKDGTEVLWRWTDLTKDEFAKEAEVAFSDTETPVYHVVQRVINKDGHTVKIVCEKIASCISKIC